MGRDSQLYHNLTNFLDRYCESISASLNRAALNNCPILVEKLKELSDRLAGESHSEKGSSWITGRIAKPNLDSIGDWLGKGLSRFVAGEGDPSTLQENEEKISVNGNFSGAFSQFSTISSTENSIVPSPSSSLLNVNTQFIATDQRLPSNHLSPLEVQKHSARTVSAMDNYRPSIRQASPGPRVASASAITTTFTQGTLNKEHYIPSANANLISDTANGFTTAKGDIGNGWDTQSSKENGNWWDNINASNATDATPVATTFYNPEATASQSTGFVSLMDHNGYHHQPTTTPSTNTSISNIPEEDDDDLGLGNDSNRKKTAEDPSHKPIEAKKEESVPPPPSGK